jgi:hypothetical protein
MGAQYLRVVPTYDAAARFLAEYARLSPAQQRAFRAAQRLFVEGLRDGGRMHPRLRVKPFKTISGVFELTWAPDGRALWRYGDEVPGQPGPHIVWLRIGTHKIFD